MGIESKWKAAALLTWLLAADSVYCLPNLRVGALAEEILQQTATQPVSAFETQYPPSNAEERILIPQASPVRNFARIKVDKICIDKTLPGLSRGFGERRSFIAVTLPGT